MSDKQPKKRKSASPRMGVPLRRLVRRYLHTRIPGAWYVVMATDDGKELICPHFYEQDRAERMAKAWRKVLPGVRVVILEPNTKLTGAMPEGDNNDR